MLDQSFSVGNFRKIIDYENRKGVYLEGMFFSELTLITKEIKDLKASFRRQRKILDAEEYLNFKTTTNEKITQLKQRKEAELEKKLEILSHKITSGKYQLKCEKADVSSQKDCFKIESSPESYFIIKQLQKNIRSTYQVKQASRDTILNQLKELLNDDFPKYIIRTDIKDFYESISFEAILTEINKENLLSFVSKKYIAQIFNSYNAILGGRAGLPRGIGISAYLSEIFMRKVDRFIQNLPNIVYYARYVDDMIMVFSPTNRNDTKDYKEQVSNELINQYRLELNLKKTVEKDLTKQNQSFEFEYLGYRFHIIDKKCKITFSDSKKNKFVQKIDHSFQTYLKTSKYNEKKARKLLVGQIKYLTSNTRLIGNKKNILIGVYFSHKALTTDKDFAQLDSYLKDKIKSTIQSQALQKRLSKYQFLIGWHKRKYYKFKPNQLGQILECWRHVI